MNFCFAVCILTAYILATVLTFSICHMQSSSDSDGLKPQLIVLIILAAFFCVFTFALLVSHMHLIMHGQTTVESMHIRSMKDREEHVLARGFQWWEFRQAILSACFLVS